MKGVSDLKLEFFDNLCSDRGLDTKKAITLSKYIFKAFELQLAGS